jgi:putative effector of murein hydrolase LrgA (UPF0299 family)
MKPITRRALRIIATDHLAPMGWIVLFLAVGVGVIKLWSMFPLTITAIAAVLVLGWLVMLVWIAAVDKAQSELKRESLRRRDS